jgi:oxygen-independent coproporphyrinogen-3 oxidase
MEKAQRLDGSHIAEERIVGVDELPFEFMLNALRLKAGVTVSSFTERTGLSVLSVAGAVDRAVARGLLEPDPTRFQASALGWQFLNDLQSEFLD